MINASEDDEEDDGFDNGSTDDRDDGDDIMIMSIKASCPLVSNSMLLRRELCYKCDFQNVVFVKVLPHRKFCFSAWGRNSKSESYALGTCFSKSYVP